jgi:hypothetical protein
LGDGEHESFDEAVRSRTAWRGIFTVSIPCGRHEVVERGGELPGAVTEEEPNGVTAGP